jgi:hypothetical protein
MDVIILKIREQHYVNRKLYMKQRNNFEAECERPIVVDDGGFYDCFPVWTEGHKNVGHC